MVRKDRSYPTPCNPVALFPLTIVFPLKSPEKPHWLHSTTTESTGNNSVLVTFWDATRATEKKSMWLMPKHVTVAFLWGVCTHIQEWLILIPSISFYLNSYVYKPFKQYMTFPWEVHTGALRYTLFFPSTPFYFKYIYYFSLFENVIIYTIYTMYFDDIHPSLPVYNFP